MTIRRKNKLLKKKNVLKYFTIKFPEIFKYQIQMPNKLIILNFTYIKTVLNILIK